MKLAKRLTALLLALVLVLSFAACSKTTTEQPAQDTANTDTPRRYPAGNHGYSG